MQSYVNRNNNNVSISVPTDSESSSANVAKFTFSFDDRIFKSELNKFLKRNRFDAFPKEYIESLEQDLDQLQEAFLTLAGRSIVNAIRAGGFLSGIVGYSGRRPVYMPVSIAAGVRTFDTRSGQLSASADFNIERNGSRSVLVVTWGPAIVPSRVPGPYVSTSTYNAIPFGGGNPLTYDYEAGIPSHVINKVAAIESGRNIYLRPVANTSMKGFFPASPKGYRIFEGASYKNYAALEKSYKAAVRDIFNKGIFKFKNSKYSLKTYSEKFLADNIKTYYNSNVLGSILPSNEGRLKSNEASFFNNVKRLFPSNDKFVSRLSFSEIRALFQVFKPGKRKGLSKGNIGISDSAQLDDFKKNLQDSLSEYLNELGL